MYRMENGEPEFFLVHPGGPFFAKKEEGAWTIPKGLTEGNEDLLATAQREFSEETGISPVPPFHSLGSVTLKSGKVVHAWCFRGTWDPETGITSNQITIAWPPRSGRSRVIPEADRGAWMNFEKAKTMINPMQVPFLERARSLLNFG
jgi:predicted NUDIX family NTP pyrophosphohydrolase